MDTCFHSNLRTCKCTMLINTLINTPWLFVQTFHMTVTWQYDLILWHVVQLYRLLYVLTQPLQLNVRYKHDSHNTIGKYIMQHTRGSCIMSN